MNSPLSFLDIESASGGYVVRARMRFTFFMRRPHEKLAPTIERAVHQLIDMFPPPEVDSMANENGDWISMGRSDLKKAVTAELVGRGSGINGTLALAGSQANIPDVSIDYLGMATDRPAFEEGACVLWFSLAPAAFDACRDEVLQFSVELADALRCAAAYCAPAVDGDESTRQRLARRYQAIDISSPQDVALDLEENLPGAYWRTYVGPHLLNTFGGRPEIDSLLQDIARLESDKAGGIWLELASEPELGDANRQEALAAHERLAGHAHQLGLLQVPSCVYFDEQGDLDPEEAQEQWHLRFVSTP